MVKFLKKLVCKHSWKFQRNISGDFINRLSTKTVYRSEWWCSKCGKLELRKELHCPSNEGIKRISISGKSEIVGATDNKGNNIL